MDHQHTHDESIPRPILIGAGLLVVFTILAISVAQWTGGPVTIDRDQPVLMSVPLRFEDMENGRVAVLNADTETTLAVLEPGEGAFIRVVMRGLVKERLRQDIGAEPPFRLTRWADGQLSLEDPATESSVAIQAFGEAQVRAFARFLAPLEAGQ